MRLADLRPCDACGGPLFTPPGRWFQVVRTCGAILGPAVVEVLREAESAGVPLERLESASDDGAVAVLGDRDPRQFREILLCVACFHERPLAEVVRRRLERIENQVAQGMVS